MDKLHTIEDFKKACYADEIVEHGSVYDDGTPAWNFSSILSKLIFEAGRWVEHYASDLWFDWQDVLNSLKEMAGTWRGMTSWEINESDLFPLKKSLLLGFRDCGVDSTSSVINRYDDAVIYNNRYGAEYRAIWRIDIELRKDGNFTVALYKVDKMVS